MLNLNRLGNGKMIASNREELSSIEMRFTVRSNA